MDIQIGVFAHNEEKNIGCVLDDLAQQSIFLDQRFNVTVTVLANGCSDETVDVSRDGISKMNKLVSSKFEVLDLPFSGKSRTWNYFIHQVCSLKPCDVVFCMDADIRIFEKNTFKGMLNLLEADSIRAVNSRPCKDIDVAEQNLGLIEKIISSAGASTSEYKDAICGQLYAAKAASLKDIYMPIGLPVEDGFLRAMISTDLLTNLNIEKPIDGTDSSWHVYESIRGLGELITHQTRIIVGSAINAAVFGYMRSKAGSYEERRAMLSEAAKDEQWLPAVLKSELPKLPFGYVPFHFLTKRVSSLLKRKDQSLVKRLILIVVGFCFDFLVYLLASYKLARGKGAGYW